MNKLVISGFLAGLAFVPAIAQSAVVFSTSNSAPVVDVVESYMIGASPKGTMSTRARNDSEKNRTLGQTFTLDNAYTVSKITVQTGINAAAYPATGDNDLLLTIGSDTTGDGSVDTFAVSNITYDLSGFQQVKDDYATFEFDAITLGTGVHSFEFAWSAQQASHNFALYRSNDGAGPTDYYTDGGQFTISAAENVGDPTYPNLGSSYTPSDYRDLEFYVQGTAVPEPSTFALLAGIATLGLVIYRRRRQ